MPFYGSVVGSARFVWGCLLLAVVVERGDRPSAVLAADTVSTKGFNRTTDQLEVRLGGGRYPNEGILELRWPPSQPEWGTLCTAVEEPSKTGHVACTDLGYPAAYSARATAPFAPDAAPIRLQGVHCASQVLRDRGGLEDCFLEPWTLAYARCDHTWDLGLVCYTGHVRLADGNSTNEGRVEFHLGGDEWVSVSAAYIPTADVACRYLGFPFAVGASGERVDPAAVLCGHGFCWGWESSPIDCQYDSKAVPCSDVEYLPDPPALRALCALEPDVVPSEGALAFRLVGSAADDHSGLVQVRDTTLPGDGWRTVCGEFDAFGFIVDEPVARLGDLVCKQLGYPWSSDSELIGPDDVRELYGADWNATGGSELLRRRVLNDIAHRKDHRDLFRWQWVRTQDMCQQYGYPGLRVTCATGVELYGERVYPCPQQTCNGRCGSQAELGVCGCDVLCTLCGDCCHDYAPACAPDGVEPLPPDFPVACRLASASTRREYFSRLCRPDWPDDDVRSRCEGDSPLDLVYHVSADESGYAPLFKNRDCAQCGHVNTTVGDLVDYEAYHNTTEPWVTGPIISACPVGFNGSDPLREGCAAYSAVFSTNTSRYKNPHCALCNGEDLTGLDYCYRKDALIYPASLEIILGRNSELWFPSPTLGISLGEPVRCLRKEYHLAVVPKPPDGDPASDASTGNPLAGAYDAARCLIRMMAWQSLSRSRPFVSQFLAADADEQGDGMLFSTPIGNFSDTKALLEGLLTGGNSSAQDAWVDNCNLEVVELAEVCPIVHGANVRQCQHRWFSTKDPEVVRNLTIGNVSALYLGQGVTVEADYLSLLQVYRDTDTGRYSTEAEVRVCGRELEHQTCRFPPASETVVIVRGDTSYLSYAGREFREGEFVALPDGLVLVCSEVFRDDGPYIDLSEPLTLVNFLGFVVSMAALVATFATYVVLAELRNIPGAAIMSLCAALFAAQLLSVTALGSTLNSSVCVAVAVVTHYLWLSTFTWQTVLAWDLRRTFAAGRPPLGASGKARRFALYSAYGWGAPLAVVGVFLAFHLCGDCTGLGYRYGSEKACWIVGRFAVLLAFGVPMMSSLVLNGVLFGMTVCGVHRTLKAAAMVHKDRSTAQKASAELVIYLKISCVMGFTWIFGCLTQVTPYRPLWFLFVVTNSAQGVIIFAVYACNARVRAMWRQRLRMTEAKTSASAARTTDTTSLGDKRAGSGDVSSNGVSA